MAKGSFHVAQSEFDEEGMIVLGVLPFCGLYSENQHVYMKSYSKPCHHISIRLAVNWINRLAKFKNSPEMVSGEGLPYQPNQA